jgi:hypothetical protein
MSINAMAIFLFTDLSPDLSQMNAPWGFGCDSSG